MSFEPGRQKTGGRKKGVPNRKSLDFAKRLEELGVDPVKEIANRISSLNDADAVSAYSQLLPYLYPKRKSVEAEITLSPETVASMSDQDLIAKAKELIEEAENGSAD